MDYEFYLTAHFLTSQNLFFAFLFAFSTLNITYITNAFSKPLTYFERFSLKNFLPPPILI